MMPKRWACIHSRHPAKDYGKQDGEGQNQNLFEDFEARVFRLFVFLENGGNGYYEADKKEDNPKNSRDNWKFPQRDGN